MLNQGLIMYHTVLLYEKYVRFLRILYNGNKQQQ